MKHISIAAFKEVLEAEKTNNSIAFINVCTPAEYKEKHIGDVKNIPLDELEKRFKELANKSTVYIHCRSGKRSLKAIEKLTELGFHGELVNVEGGQLAWEEAKLPTRTLGNHLPIIRQVFITAGILIALANILALTINQNFIFISTLIGLGLIFAGITGWCGMAFLLAKMPWNK